MHLHTVTRSLVTPAAGSPVTFEPSNTDEVEVITLTANFTTGVTAANRGVYLELTDQNGLRFFIGTAGYKQIAETVYTYQWALGLGRTTQAEAEISGLVSAPLPWARLRIGDSLKVSASELKPVDAFSAIVLRYREGNRWRELQAEEQIEAALVP